MTTKKHSEQYDAYYDEQTNEWLEDTCTDADCEFCVGRPATPIPEYAEFNDWFDEIENFSMRSERFYESVTQFNSQAGVNANLRLWLEAAFNAGRNKHNE